MNSYKFTILIFTLTIFILSFNTASSQMYWNQAASFPGTLGSHVSVASNSTLDLSNGFTIEALINPSSTSFIARGIVSKSTGLGMKYAVRIVNSRIVVITNSVQRLISRSSNLIPVNQWTHLAVTLDTLGTYKLYLNGILDTTTVHPGSMPLATPDSLHIGTTGSSTEFAGLIDEVRIWNTSLSVLNILVFMKSTFGITGNEINNLVLSLPFQNNTGTGSLLSGMDYSKFGNNAFFRNVSAFDMKDKPSFIHQYNDCAFFSGSGGGFIGNDNPSVSPTSKLTIECWIFPKSDNYGLIYKGPFFTSNVNYGMKVVSGKLNAGINNTLITSTDSVKKERWSHFAFTYFGATGRYEFYVNGKRGTTGNITPGNITDGTDSMIIGAYAFSPSFTGFMDEFRITSEVKSAGEINKHMFTSLNESNDNDASLNAVYNFDVSTFSATDGGPRLNISGSVSFTFNGAFNLGSVQSPINSLSFGNFHKGYYMNMPNKRIPATGSTGTTRDTIEILSSETINDLNIFVGINHSAENNIRLTITNPLGASTDLFANTSLAAFASNIVTVFDSDADSSLINNRYINFGPKVKPQFDIDAIFSGSNSKGKWILTVTDDAGSDTGFISGWGIQINNQTNLPSNLECISLIEGFYNSSSNTITPDTVSFSLRSALFPYPVIETSKAKLNSSGIAIASFLNAQPLTDYFLVLNHRNSIETWSNTVIKFSQFSNQAQFNFTDQLSKAFGNNQKQVDASPLKFALYGGDIDQNGFIDLNDITLSFNDASSFISGYNTTDVTGDNLSDLSDVLLVFNNAGAFVSKIVP